MYMDGMKYIQPENPRKGGGFLLLRRFVQRRKDEMFCTFLTNKFVFSIKNCLTFAKTQSSGTR